MLVRLLVQYGLRMSAKNVFLLITVSRSVNVFATCTAIINFSTPTGNDENVCRW